MKERVKLTDKELLELRTELLKENREIRHRLDYVSKHLDKLWEHVATTNERLQDLEIYMNILSRLITTLCIEKMGMKLTSLKQILKRIQDDAIADSQVSYLEDLYRLDNPKEDGDPK